MSGCWADATRVAAARSPFHRRAAVQLLEPAGNALGIVLAHGQGDVDHLLVRFLQLLGEMLELLVCDVLVKRLAGDALEAPLEEAP